MNNKKVLSLGIALIPALFLSGCVPALIGGAAGVGAAAVKEKGLGGSINDTQISSKIKVNLYAKDPELHQKVGVNVQNGEVLLTGSVPDQKTHLEVIKMCWEVPGVNRVIDNIGVSTKNGTFGETASDAWITTKIKSSTLFTRDVQSVNYSIKTVSGVVYIMGIAQDKAELDRVLECARSVDNVKKVVSYVRIKGQPNV